VQHLFAFAFRGAERYLWGNDIIEAAGTIILSSQNGTVCGTDYTTMNNNILLIDDDPDDHEIFDFALEIAYPTATCEHSYNCQDAVEKIKRRHSPLPENIFLDVNMPMMELPKCLFAIHEALGVNHADIVILTGFAAPDLPNYNAFGVVKVISKPSTVELLAEKIQDVMGHRASA